MSTMNTKLTLVMEPDLIEAAKEYARRQHTSLSKLVERYLAVASSADTTWVAKPVKRGPLTSALAGAIRPLTASESRKSGKQLVAEAKLERFG